jgi:hypothetical protein
MIQMFLYTEHQTKQQEILSVNYGRGLNAQFKNINQCVIGNNGALVDVFFFATIV